MDLEEAEEEAQGGERRRMVLLQARLLSDALERAQEDCAVQNYHAARAQLRPPRTSGQAALREQRLHGSISKENADMSAEDPQGQYHD